MRLGSGRPNFGLVRLIKAELVKQLPLTLLTPPHHRPPPPPSAPGNGIMLIGGLQLTFAALSATTRH